MRTAGYDPAVASMHTNCYLDRQHAAGRHPLHQLRTILRPGVPHRGGTSNYIWYLRMGNGVVTGLEVAPDARLHPRPDHRQPAHLLAIALWAACRMTRIVDDITKR